MAERMIIINKEEPGYPALLKEIKEPPEKLYCIGDVSLLESLCVAVVGSRKFSEYGRWAAIEVSKRLAGAGVTVVSGMAMGVDTCAHKGALMAGGKTIAVMGCGLDITYPAANRDLKRQIANEGLLVSEYPPGRPATRFTFPERNRIISGLSRATVLAEAGNNSGSLITAEFAMAQGRSVYVIPANVNNPNALGGNMLLRDGAMPLVILDDILWDLGVIPKIKEETLTGLGSEEKKVVELIAASGEIMRDEISRGLMMPPERVNGILTILEMKGLIQAALGKIFLAK